MKTETINRLLQNRKAKRAVALATNLVTGDEVLVYPSDASGTLAAHPSVVEAAREALRADRNGTVETPEGDVFIHVYNPALRFIIVGAVHIAQPLARMAALAEYDVTVVDPRGSFATDDRFPGVTLNDDWPDEALTSLRPDRRTAVITLTHDPKLDDPALEVALKSDAFYIGSLGSRRTHAARLERLQALGFTATDMARIHGPVGLSLGAKSPAEIAVSILAQVTSVLHGSEQKAAA